MEDYTIVCSNRSSVGLWVDREGRLTVRAPYRVPDDEIRRIVESESAWIERERARQQMRREAHPEPDEAQRRALIRKAKTILPPKIAHYAALMGVQPTRITITGARTRFGSCSSKGRLCFSWRLMQYPPEAVDYVVVHELAHLAYRNHSPAFYALIERYLPDYKARRKLLRE